MAEVMIKRFFRLLKRGEKQGLEIPDVLLDARDELMDVAPEANPAPIPQPAPAASTGPVTPITDADWHKSLRAFRDITKGNMPTHNVSVFTPGFYDTVFSRADFDAAIKKTIAANHAREPLDMLHREIAGLAGFKDGWVNDRAYDIAMSRVVQARPLPLSGV